MQTSGLTAALFASATATVALSGPAISADAVRTDFQVQSAPEIDLFVREVRGTETEEADPPVLLLHGARVGAVPTSDAVEDVKAILDEIAERHPGVPVSAFGWATGSHWPAAPESHLRGGKQR